MYVFFYAFQDDQGMQKLYIIDYIYRVSLQ